MNRIHWTHNISAFASGLLFGIGLILADMANPAKVLGFLDIFGSWDPSLGLVMAGALLVAVPTFFMTQNKPNLLGEKIDLPLTKKIDHALILGSVTFGIGWGLAGICPGPSIVLVGALSDHGLIFFVSLLLGFAAYQLASKK